MRDVPLVLSNWFHRLISVCNVSSTAASAGIAIDRDDTKDKERERLLCFLQTYFQTELYFITLDLNTTLIYINQHILQ